MGSDVLKIFLPSFLVIFIAITFFWKAFRKFIRIEEYRNIEKEIKYRRLKRINILFLIFMLIFSVMILIFSAFPDHYHIFIPLDKFDHPLINSIGILLLKVALIWMIVAQLHIDKELYKYSRKIEDLKLMELIHFSEKMFLGGLTVMFVGMFVTITNVIGIVLGVMAVFFYYKLVYVYKT